MLKNYGNCYWTNKIWIFSDFWRDGVGSLSWNRIHAEEHVYNKLFMCIFSFYSIHQLVDFGLGFDSKTVSADHPSTDDSYFIHIL